MSNPDLLLAHFIRSELGRPFIWGETNCVSLALRAIDAMHGLTLHAKHRHTMSSAARAAAFTRKHGISGVLKRLQADGITPVDLPYAQDGDILLGHTQDKQIAAHLVLGARVLSVTQESGVILLPRSAVIPAPTLAIGWRNH